MKNEITDFLLRLIFPRRCIICRRFVERGHICPDCKGKETAVQRNFNIERGGSSRLMRVHAPHRYTGNYRKNIHRFKFDGVTDYARAIGQLIVDRVPEEAFEGVDFITFVPLNRDVRRRRGYNQAELIARAVAELKGIPVRDVLEKVKQNRPQHSLSASARKKNVKGVFAVKEDIKGQNIILADDIITTGETMCECAKLLFRAGAGNVTGICAASAE